jgi:hypothetical protein
VRVGMSDALCPQRTTLSRRGPRPDGDPAGSAMVGLLSGGERWSVGTHFRWLRSLTSLLCGPAAHKPARRCVQRRPTAQSGVLAVRYWAPKFARRGVQQCPARSLASMLCRIGHGSQRDGAGNPAKSTTLGGEADRPPVLAASRCPARRRRQRFEVAGPPDPSSADALPELDSTHNRCAQHHPTRTVLCGKFRGA